jgi:uncharacterized protein with gpF-like domain
VRACGCAITTLHAQVIAGNTNPQQAIDFLKAKVDMPSATWTDLWEAEHSIAFTVAGAQSDALVADFHDAVTKAIESGETLDEFRKDFDAIVEEHGWDYNGSANWRSRVIFDTNMNTAYAAGRWEQIQAVKGTRPYLRYVHLEGQAHPRPIHEEWGNYNGCGVILPVDDEWWLTHYPPNGWFCHCTVQSLSADDIDRYGYTVADQAPDSPLVEATVKTSDGGTKTVMVPEGIDPGFAYRPGAMPDAIDDSSD